MAGPYRGPIIDAHHHLWDLGLARYPWLAADAGERGGLGDLDRLRRNYLPDDYRREAATQPIVATVHVEAGWDPSDPLGETEWLQTLDTAGGIAARHVAHVPLASPDAPALIEAQAAFQRTVGVRDILSWDPDPARRFAARDGIMSEPAWRAGLRRLARHGLAFDLMVFPRQLAEAARLAADFPDQLFVLNHCGSPIDRDPDGMRRWREGLALLARRPNVRVKISDLVAYDHDWTIESLTPVVRHCIDCFGPERAMFASDFPVAGLHASFDEVWESFLIITADLSEDEQKALFLGTAARTYRLDVLSSSGGLAAGEEQEA